MSAEQRVPSIGSLEEQKTMEQKMNRGELAGRTI
jgi:hypothetical protein